MNRKKIVIAGFACAFIAFALFFISPFGGASLYGDSAVGKKSALPGERRVERSSATVPRVQQSTMPGITVAQHDPHGKTESAGEASDSAPLEPSAAPPEPEVVVVDKQLLREQFPDKIDLIPITPEEVEARKKVILARYEKFRKIIANKATEAEINAYYDEKENLTLDRMEIVGFSINEYADRMGEDSMFRHKTTMMILEKQLEGIPEKRAKALKRLQNATRNNGTG